MLFNSPEFIFLFLPISLVVYVALQRHRCKSLSKYWLITCSLFFYGWWNVIYLPLLLGSIICNFLIGKKLNEPTVRRKGAARKGILIFGVTMNLALLAYFKYTGFFISNLNLLAEQTLTPPDIVLPLAISFFTFQQVAYLVDCYRLEAREHNFANYTLFVTFFPQLIAGPIVHHSEMIPQIEKKWRNSERYRNLTLGLFIFSLGLFKKVILADTFAQWATMGFDQKESLTFLEGWSTSLSYTFQLYFDFSGYSDMAIGAALLFCIKLPINFNSPYKALDIQDFWRRWHITLSRFLRDYLYVPLGGNRHGPLRTGINLLITFILGGLWHGAGWMFVCWGALHGLALVGHRAWRHLGCRMPAVLAWLVTFNFVNIAWIFFRARDMDSAFKVLAAMFTLTPNAVLGDLFRLLDAYRHTPAAEWLAPSPALLGPSVACWLLAGLGTVLMLRNSGERDYRNEGVSAWAPFGYAILATTAVIGMSISSHSEFIYFNF